MDVQFKPDNKKRFEVKDMYVGQTFVFHSNIPVGHTVSERIEVAEAKGDTAQASVLSGGRGIVYMKIADESGSPRGFVSLYSGNVYRDESFAEAQVIPVKETKPIIFREEREY